MSTHVNQVASFEKLLGFCNAHGAEYNPSKAALQPAALSALLTSAQQSLEAAQLARTNYVQAVNARLDAFNDLSKFMTRVVNTLAATDASASVLHDAYLIVNRGRTAPAKTAAVPANSPPAEPQVKSRSVSQLAFESKASNFDALVKLVKSTPAYQPNEVDLQINALQLKGQGLHALNSAVTNALVVLSNARANRNQTLYDHAGIHTVARATKHYIKAAFGYQSIAYSQVKGLRFINQKLA